MKFNNLIKKLKNRNFLLKGLSFILIIWAIAIFLLGNKFGGIWTLTPVYHYEFNDLLILKENENSSFKEDYKYFMHVDMRSKDGFIANKEIDIEVKIKSTEKANIGHLDHFLNDTASEIIFGDDYMFTYAGITLYPVLGSNTDKGFAVEYPIKKSDDGILIQNAVIKLEKKDGLLQGYNKISFRQPGEYKISFLKKEGGKVSVEPLSNKNIKISSTETAVNIDLARKSVALGLIVLAFTIITFLSQNKPHNK